jgi:glycosyltransferase involved in cell wall biosynthesis
MTRRRIAVVASEILGRPGTGGPGTADSLLAVALARHGHEVELLVAPGRAVAPITPEWEGRYAAANLRIRSLQEDVSVRPSFLSPAWHVYDALRADPPDVVIADDWRALAYAALRSRQVGRSLTETAFVIYSHGPARVFAAAAQKVPDTVARFGEEVAQRACVELADAVVSPSKWLVTWMQEHGWPLSRPVRVIQNLWESTALGEPAAPLAAASPIRRLAFFGQLRVGKGVRVFIDSLRMLDPALLDGIEVLFLGHSRRWTAEQLHQAVGRDVRVETGLDRTAAIRELKVPGTLAVMPSLLENSPYAVAECIEHGIPFVGADVGGTPELVAEEDRARVLRKPTAAAFAAALEDALRNGAGPARPAHAAEGSLSAWLELVASVAPQQRETRAPAGDWVVVPETQNEELREELREALLAAQAASGADAVTTAVRTPDNVRLFLGDPGALGLIENQYGVIGLVRHEDAEDVPPWLLLARIALAGGRIVSIPDPLATYSGDDSRADALAVLEAFESAKAADLQGLPQLTATLAAALARGQSDGAAHPGLLQRLRSRLR